MTGIHLRAMLVLKSLASLSNTSVFPVRLINHSNQLPNVIFSSFDRIPAEVGVLKFPICVYGATDDIHLSYFLCAVSTADAPSLSDLPVYYVVIRTSSSWNWELPLGRWVIHTTCSSHHPHCGHRAIFQVNGSTFQGHSAGWCTE